MILYDKQNRAFVLGGKNYSYLMHVNACGFLQNLHYGSKTEIGDLGYLISHIGSKYAPVKSDLNMDCLFDVMPSECGSYGRGDFREPTVVIERADGASMSRLRYASHKITNGVYNIPGLPHARSGGQTLEITLKDDFSPVEVVLKYTAWDEYDVLSRATEIRNAGKESVKLNKAFSFCAELPEAEYKMLRLHGSWAMERMPEWNSVAHGVARIQSLRGASSHQMNPLTVLFDGEPSERTGECYGFMLVYSGSFAITAEKTYFGYTRVQGGINDIGFRWELGGGESFYTPQALLCYSEQGMGELSRAYSDFLRERIIDPAFVNKRRPIVINNWEATYFDFDAEKLKSIIDAAAPLGIDTFVLDDGWFGKRDGDTSGLGDWLVNEKKLKGGLKAVAEHCGKRGLKLGLWFEPEMISEDSDLYRAHPDWAVGKLGQEPVRSRNQLVLDFTRKDVVDYIFGVMSDVIKNNGISYVKWDMNRPMTEFYSNTLSADRQGEFAHRYILGVYSLAERLTAAFPDLFMEGCAGGGGRFDAGMLYYFPQFWTSDDTDAFQRALIQWGTSVGYPVSAMSCHVSVCPNHQTGRTTPLSTRGNIASLGAFGYELDLTKLSDEEKRDIKRQILDYKRIDALVLNGDLYRLIDPFGDKWFAEMIVSKDKTEAYVVGERLRGVPNDITRRIKLDGLDPDRNYTVEESGVTASGKSLMRIGLVLPSLADYESFAWHLKAVK